LFEFADAKYDIAKLVDNEEYIDSFIKSSMTEQSFRDISESAEWMKAVRSQAKYSILTSL
jgi:hypothetical protein